MKLFKKIVAVVMAVAMLTACGGSGGGGGTGGGGTPIAPVAFKNTKTYKMLQDGKGKSLYMEYWVAETDSTGTLIEEKDKLAKEGALNGNSYTEIYDNNVLERTTIIDGSKEYMVMYDTGDDEDWYSEYAWGATRGGAEIPEGASIYIDMKRINQATGGTYTGSDDIVSNMNELSESNVTVSTGTYQGYYAEIFTSASNSNRVTYAYDKNDKLKAIVTVSDDDTLALFLNKFEYDSPLFKSSKLNITSYGAMDVTNAYIAGVRR